MADSEITPKLCECGCGGLAPIARRTYKAKGYIQGQAIRFIVGHCKPARTTSGYPVLYRPDHPKALARNGCVPEHIIVAESALGRYLPVGAEVHHVDEDSTNSANRNLVICQDNRYHKLLHVRARVVKAGGDPDTERICATCQRLRPFEAFNKAASDKNTGRQKHCRECSSAYQKTYVRPSRRGDETKEGDAA